MIVLHVRTLGGLRQTGDGEFRVLRRKPLALLTYLARRGPGAITRTELATLFWGERGEERARQSLRQALLELKQTLGDKVDVDAETVRLASDAVELDVVAFEQDLSAGRAQEAVGRWVGEFFEGAEDIGGDGFRRWIDNERVALHQQLGAAMGKLIGDAELAGNWTGAVAWAQRWAAALPFDEAPHLRLIEALRMSGRSAEALKTHAAFLTRVRAALDVEPSAEFLRLGDGLADGARDELVRQGRGSAAVHSPSFVGRGAVMSELLDAWKTAVDGTPVVVFMEGAAGCGLTRVCDELVARVEADAIVLAGRGSGSGDDFATASAVFEPLRTAAEIAGASPEALAEMTRLVPALASRFRHLPAPVGDASALRDGVAQTLLAVSEEQPVLVVLDDAHAADDASRRLIASVASRLTGSVMLLLAADEGERQSGPALATFLGTRGLRHLRLSELTVAEVETMLESMATLDPADRHALAKRLHEDTGGLPHDVRELVMALVDDHLLTPTPGGLWRLSTVLAARSLRVPAAVRERTRLRLDRLTPSARSLGDAMAVLAGPTDPTIAAAVADIATDEAEPALGDLVAGRLVYERAAQPGMFEFTSPLIARTVASLVPATKREALHARAAHVAAANVASPPVARTWRAARLAVPAVAVVALAAIAVRGRFPNLVSGGEAPVPVIALGRVADYRQNTASNLTKPLTDMLATNLGRARHLRVVSTARMYELVSQGGDTSEASLVRAARRAGATELVDGALYARDDGGFRLDLRRVDLASGNIRKTHSVTGTTIFELADSGTARVAADFGETTPPGSIADVTTRSVTAYRLYEQGLRAYFANDLRAAEPLFEAALREDSTFAMAAYYSAQSSPDSRVALGRYRVAAQLATRTSDRERLTILARVAFLASSPALRALADTMMVRYPDEVEGYFFSGLSLLVEGDFMRGLVPLNRVVAMDSLALNGERAHCEACEALRQIISAYQLADSLPAAEREARRWVRLQPRSPVPWHTLADVLSQNGRPTQALAALDSEATYDAGRREGERLLGLAVHRIYAGDFEQVDRLTKGELESGSPYRTNMGLWYRALSFRQQGRLNEALAAAKRYRAMADPPRAIVIARRAAPQDAFAEAQILFEMGRYRASAALFDSVARWVVGDESPSQIAHARVWAMTHGAGALIAAGDTAGIADRIDTLQVLGAQSSLGRDKLLHHFVRGLLLGARGHDEAAIGELRKAIWSWNFGYTRTNVALAAALMRQQRPKEAIAVLQPALRGTIEASNYYVTRTDIHEMLAEAWSAVGGAAAGDSAAAHAAYVVRAWSRADPAFAGRVRRVLAFAGK